MLTFRTYEALFPEHVALPLGHAQIYTHIGVGIAQLAERRTRGRKVTGLIPGKWGRRIFFLQSQLCVPTLIRCPFRPLLPQWYVTPPPKKKQKTQQQQKTQQHHHQSFCKKNKKKKQGASYT